MAASVGRSIRYLEKLVRGFARFSLFLESLDLIGVHAYSFLVKYLKGERVFALKCLEGATGGRDIFSITVVQSLFEFTDGGRASLVDDLAEPIEYVFGEGSLFESTRFAEEFDSEPF